MNNDLKTYLLNTIPGAKLVSGGKEILVRCPRCGDSRNRNSAHFYISLGDANHPPMCHCKKCNVGGVFNAEKLKWFDIYDAEIGKELTNTISSYKTIYNTNSIKRYNTVLNIVNGSYTWDYLTEQKLNYINSRLGLNLSPEEVLQKKIVFNLFDLLNYNRITSATRAENILQELNDKFIGFLSYDNKSINMRNVISPTFTDKRYINYNIYNNSESKRYYIIPTNVRLDQKVIINLSEGPFDILGVYYNLPRYENAIYASVGGKGYVNALKFFLQEMAIIYAEIHIYLDNDVEDKVLYQIRKYVPNNIMIWFHRNIFGGEKDFGVPKERIIERKESMYGW